MNGLIALFPEVDKACKDPARLFYGTNKKGELLNPTPISVELLTSVLESDKLKGGGRLRKINPKTPGAIGARKHGFSAASYSIYIEDRSKATNQQKLAYYEMLKRNKRNKCVDRKKLASRVRIFDEFLHGNKRCTYAQLLGIAQNLA